MAASKRKKDTSRRGPVNSHRADTWPLVLFGLPFVAASMVMLLLGVVPTVGDWSRMRSWQPVQATVISAGLETSRGSKSTTSYKAIASYRYQVAGREYLGQRIAIDTSADNTGDFQTQMALRLEDARQSGRPVQAWVNPANPGEAVIDRSLRTGLLAIKLVFSVLMGALGLGILLKAWRASRAARAV